MSDVRYSRIYASLPHELSKAVKMKAILDECTVSEVLINALSYAYADDQMITKAIEDFQAATHSTTDTDSTPSESHNEDGNHMETDY